ncbi:GCN5-related N-acetyltransferase [Shewanella halifaxensis HAW-EB4]|uniref:GCN5-related N-acetyltransferase n=1 Tax=Shewanella halifaxensis (strain HAW-EB4) TaxID=458817 RepID=B0TLH8_SHEHH|nr:GNAT family N-acetyltransferase [Shewanella halifaxensis]ABZ75928.1 GCN5-related N-acetyltransferase [Shewanella halifaxensis HAW-EB4]
MTTVSIIRPFSDKDASQLAQVFHLSVNQGSSSHYNEQQRAAWSPKIRSEQIWLERLAGTYTWVAEIEQKVIGFINLKRVSGFDFAKSVESAKSNGGIVLSAEIDCLFVHPDYTGVGAASNLYQVLEAKALSIGLVQLTVEASYLAKPFFERFGFHATRQNSHQRGEQVLVNFSMSKALV